MIGICSGFNAGYSAQSFSHATPQSTNRRGVGAFLFARTEATKHLCQNYLNFVVFPFAHRQGNHAFKAAVFVNGSQQPIIHVLLAFLGFPFVVRSAVRNRYLHHAIDAAITDRYTVRFAADGNDTVQLLFGFHLIPFRSLKSRARFF